MLASMNGYTRILVKPITAIKTSRIRAGFSGATSAANILGKGMIGFVFVFPAIEKWTRVIIVSTVMNLLLKILGLEIMGGVFAESVPLPEVSNIAKRMVCYL